MPAYDMIGQIALFAGAYTPRNWKRCDGSTLNIVEYRALFDIIGDTYGGNGTTTFALPNLGGRYMVCAQGVRPNLRPEAWSEILPPGEDSPVEYVQSVTYAEIYSLLQSELLVPGKQYLITDFRAAWFAVFSDPEDGGTVEGSEHVAGSAEPLLVTASKVNALHCLCISTLYPTDIIEYNPLDTDFLDDIFYSFEGTIIDDFKGVITRRIDTVNNIDLPFDWRNLTFRRWKVDADTYAGGTTYEIGDFVISSNFIYVSIESSHSGNTPASSPTKWQKVIDASTAVDRYWSISPNGFYVYFNGDYYGSTASAVYQDFNVFGGYSAYNVTMGRGIDDLSALNNVFKQTSNGTVHDITIGRGSYSNTIGAAATNNIIGDGFRGNTIGTSFNYNTLYDCSYNTVLGSFQYNNAFRFFRNNLIGATFSYNSLLGFFQHNTISANFRQNTCGNVSTEDWKASTLVYAAHTKNIMLSPDGTAYVHYIANGGTATVAAATT